MELRALPGQLTITGTGGGRVTLTGELDWRGRPPVAVTRFDRAARVLRLSFRCAPASPCTGSYRLAVPAGTATVLYQPSGRVAVSGLAGPLRITASHSDIAAAGLRSPVLAVAVTSGHLSASFGRPPRRVSVALTSAQAALWLPGRVAYQVSQHVTGGFVRVAVPRAGMAARTISARIASGELELLPSVPARNQP